jgi:signal transduction histidine kinase
MPTARSAQTVAMVLLYPMLILSGAFFSLGLLPEAVQKISTFLPTDLPSVSADPAKFGQVLLNLLTNAIKYTHENGSVSVEARPKGDVVEIWVRHHNREKTRTVFSGSPGRLVATRSQGGTGLGWPSSASSWAARHHPCRQNCKGLRFVFTMPISASRRTTGGGETARGGAQRPNAILVADDDPDI